MNNTSVQPFGNAPKAAAQVFQFKQEHEVRAVMIDAEPWFAAVDVCQSLAIVNTARALARLDEDEKGVHSMNTPGGVQELSIVNESGLYSLILTSRKAEAKAFKKWVTAEVLPAIRKHGMYLHAPALRESLTAEHRHQIGRKIDLLSSGWAMGHESKNWIYNHMRVVFSVPRVEDIPDDQFDTVMNLLASKERARDDFISFVVEARRWFEREVFGGGAPWTPTVKAKLTRQLKRQVILPPKTDWLALAQMVDQPETRSAVA